MDTKRRLVQMRTLGCLIGIGLVGGDVAAVERSSAAAELRAALAATTPHSALADPAHLFDRFVGTWEATGSLFAAGGGAPKEIRGEVIFGWVLDGRAVQDIWSGYQLDTPEKRDIGTTIRFYDSTSQRWRVIWIAPDRNMVTMVEGGAVGDRIVLEGSNPDGSRRRWSFNEIADDSFVWRGETASDGKTWHLGVEYHMRRRSSGRDDMMSRLLANGPHTPLGAQADVFGRFAGTWDADFSFIAKDGSVRHSPGELRFAWVLDGWAMQDVWIGYPKEPGGERVIGTSVRFVDPATGKWTVLFVAPAFNLVTRVDGSAEGDRIVLRGKDGDGSEIRWSFNEITPGSFLWRGEASSDGGKTWVLQEEHRMRRRVTPAG